MTGSKAVQIVPEGRKALSTALRLASAAGSFYVGQTLFPNGGNVMI